MTKQSRSGLLVSLLCALVFTVVPTKPANAYQIASAAWYDDGSNSLVGYSQTWKDWWDWDSGMDCLEYYYDPETSEYTCYSWQYWEDWVSVWASLYRPSGALAALDYGRTWASAQVVHVAGSPEIGTWWALGDHYVEHDMYVYDGYWGYWYFVGTAPLYWGQTSAQATVWPIPDSETTQSSGWSEQNTTVHKWIQTLNGGTFGGRVVTEQDPGGGGPDTCWFPGSILPPATSLTGGNWQVGGDNRWGPDDVGWFYQAVLYYRGQGRAPCETQFYQRMVIDRPGSTAVEYVTNLLRMGMTAITVWSQRAGQEAERVWP